MKAAEIVETEKDRFDAKERKPIKPKVDVAEVLEKELDLAFERVDKLNRWLLMREIRPTIELPIIYNDQRKQFEFLKKGIYTEDGRLRTAQIGGGFEKIERNPTSNIDGFVEIVGSEIKTETFSKTQSMIKLYTKANDLFIRLYSKPEVASDWVLVRGSLNEITEFNMSVIKVEIKNVNTNGTYNAYYQLIGVV